MKILCGDALEQLETLPSDSVHCCVTSPPYYGLRSYLPSDSPDKHLEQGLEESPEEYVSGMVAVFREVRRVLHPSGTLWLNVGDSYAAQRSGTAMPAETLAGGVNGKPVNGRGSRGRGETGPKHRDASAIGLKHKDLIGIPWRLAFALQQDGWYLRQDIIWHKPSPMPESVQDRCTKAHEYVFLLAKSEKYFYDSVAVSEDSAGVHGMKRNRRSVWTVPTKGYKEAHFATMPPQLAETCIKAGTSERGCCPECLSPWRRVVERTKIMRTRPNDFVKRTGEEGTGNSCPNTVAGVAVSTVGWEPSCKCGSTDTVPCTVLDPFAGSGTTLAVAASLGLDGIGIELNPDYVELARKRISESTLLFS